MDCSEAWKSRSADNKRMKQKSKRRAITAFSLLLNLLLLNPVPQDDQA
jgi:hypothetical protein